MKAKANGKRKIKNSRKEERKEKIKNSLNAPVFMVYVTCGAGNENILSHGLSSL